MLMSEISAKKLKIENDKYKLKNKKEKYNKNVINRFIATVKSCQTNNTKDK